MYANLHIKLSYVCYQYVRPHNNNTQIHTDILYNVVIEYLSAIVHIQTICKLTNIFLCSLYMHSGLLTIQSYHKCNTMSTCMNDNYMYVCTCIFISLNHGGFLTGDRGSVARMYVGHPIALTDLMYIL